MIGWMAMDEDDQSLWRRFVRDIERLPKKGGARHEALENIEKKPFTPMKPASAPAAPLPPAPRGSELDRRTEERLRAGKMPVEARLDLHGMSQDQARRALEFFIGEAYAARKRTVLVITGKGRPGEEPEHWSDPEPGVLKRRVPDWLSQPPLSAIVLKVYPAARKHGGDGALYVYLRRVRG